MLIQITFNNQAFAKDFNKALARMQVFQLFKSLHCIWTIMFLIVYKPSLTYLPPVSHVWKSFYIVVTVSCLGLTSC